MDKNAPNTKGKVTLSFDDGWRCIYENALPIIEKARLKSTHYIISGYLDDAQFPQYMNLGHLSELKRSGHEIGCHSVSHKHLTKEPLGIIESEIFLSLKYLREKGFSVETFAYPYGEYDDGVVDVVKRAGFAGARSTNRGFNIAGADPYLLQCQAVKVSTLVSEVVEWIDTAVRNGSWLILMFHQIDHEGREWSCPQDRLAEIVKYIKVKNLNVVTVSEGLKTLKSL